MLKLFNTFFTKTEFRNAVETNDLYKLKILHEKRYILNFEAYLTIEWVIKNGQTEMYEYYLNNFYIIEDNKKNLKFCITYGQHEMLKLFLRKKYCNIYEKDFKLAISTRNLEIIKTLFTGTIKFWIDMHYFYLNDKEIFEIIFPITPIHCYDRFEIINLIINLNDLDRFNLLLSEGISFKDNLYIFKIILENDNFEMFKIMVEKHLSYIDMDLIIEKDIKYLLFLVKNKKNIKLLFDKKYIEKCIYLIENDYFDKTDEKIINYALKLNNDIIINLLIKKEFNLTNLNIDILIQNQNIEILEMIIFDKEITHNHLKKAFDTRNLRLIKLILEFCQKVNDSVLTYALQNYCNMEIFALLMKNSKNINMDSLKNNYPKYYMKYLEDRLEKLELLIKLSFSEKDYY